MRQESLEALLAPVSPAKPAGDDLSLGQEMDEIREARKGDDGGLPQGEWTRPLQAPQWPRVLQLCEDLLRRRSKDLQVACWRGEALTHLEGFQGLASGLDLIQGLLDRFWEGCHPGLEEGSAEARMARLEWLDSTLPLAVQQIPLTSAASGGLSLLRWKEALQADKSGPQPCQDPEPALAEDRITGDLFQNAVKASGPAFLGSLQEGVRSARAAAGNLQATLDRRFGPGGPMLSALDETLQACHDLLEQCRRRHFPGGDDGPDRAGPASAMTGPGLPGGRLEAIQSLRKTAAWFRAQEPHSPVAHLVERAARWAEMPLEAWLREVVKDAPALAQLEELLSLGSHRR